MTTTPTLERPAPLPRPQVRTAATTRYEPECATMACPKRPTFRLTGYRQPPPQFILCCRDCVAMWLEAMTAFGTTATAERFEATT